MKTNTEKDSTEYAEMAVALDLAGWLQLWRAIAAALPAPRASRVLRVLRTMVEAGGAGASGPVRIHVDALSEDRVVELLPQIQASAPGADRAYVLRGAVKVGLNRLCAPGREYSGADYTPKAIEGVRAVEVVLEPNDVPRAAALAVVHWVPVEHVIGAALCTGLAMLAGVNAPIEGPFKGE